MNHLITESDVSHEFYHQGRLRGWDLWTQVKFPSIHHRSREFVVDCVVGINNKPVCVVEFKREGKKKPKPHSRQGRAYADMGLPVIYCLGSSGMIGSVDAVEDEIWQLR